MANISQTILGIFSDRNDAESAITELEDLGYDPKDISVMIRSKDAIEQIKTNTGKSILKGTATGATAGGAFGVLTGLLVGVGTITIPGIGLLFIGGPIAATLGITGAAATAISAATSGIIAGGIVGTLVGFGLPEGTARVYESRLKEGAIVLAVTLNETGDRDQIREVFNKYNADQIRTIGGYKTAQDRYSRLHTHL